MRSGYVRKLESGNWYVVEYVGRKHEVLLDEAGESDWGAHYAVARATMPAGSNPELPAGFRLGEKQQKHGGLDWWSWAMEQP